MGQCKFFPMITAHFFVMISIFNVNLQFFTKNIIPTWKYFVLQAMLHFMLRVICDILHHLHVQVS